MKRPNKRELLISVLSLAVILGVVLAQSSTSEFGPALPASNVASAPSLQYPPQASVASSNGYSLAAGNSQRVLETSQGIAGQINSDKQFENVTIKIQILTNNLGGYIQQEVLNFNNDLWDGNWLINLPSANATLALLSFRDLIKLNGKVTSIQVQILDVTNQTGGNKSLVAWSPLNIVLQQINPAPPSQFTGAFALLGSIGTTAAYFAVIGVPLYLGILAFIYIARRGLVPLLIWTHRASKPKNSNSGS